MEWLRRKEEEGMVTRGGEEGLLSPRSRLFMSQVGEKEVKKIKRECDKGKFADLVTQVWRGQVSLKTSVVGGFCEDAESAGEFILHQMGLGGYIMVMCLDLGTRPIWIQAWHLCLGHSVSTSGKWRLFVE